MRVRRMFARRRIEDRRVAQGQQGGWRTSHGYSGNSKIVGGLKVLSMLLLARSSYSAPGVQNWELLGYLGNQARLLCGYSTSVLRRLCVNDWWTGPALNKVEAIQPTPTASRLQLALLPAVACYRDRCNNRCGR